jgi:DNA repair photolyase
MSKLKVLYTPSGRAGEYADHGYALNLFNGCPHGCTYCYAPACMHRTREEFHATVTRREGLLEKLAADLGQVGLLSEPIFLCFSCDPFPLGHKDLWAEVTLPAIQLIHNAGNRVRILTKSGILPSADLLEGDEYGVTLTALRYDEAKAEEPNAAAPAMRAACLMAAHELGITTWASLEPVLDPADALAWITEIAPFTDVIKVGKLNHDARAKQIDWAKFAIAARELLEKLGCTYVLKADLRAYLPEVLR